MMRSAATLLFAAALCLFSGGALAADRVAEGGALFATGARPGAPPPRAMAGQASLPASSLPCAACHGATGRGGRAEAGVAAPAIAWSALSRPAPGRGPYDEASVLRAVMQGLAPGGRRLDAAMPRFELSLEDGAALLAFLRALDSRAEPGVEPDAVHVGLLLPPGPAGDAFAASLDAALLRAAPDGVFGRRMRLHRAVVSTAEEAAQRSAMLLAHPVLLLVSALPPGDAAAAIDRAARAARVPLLAGRAAPADEAAASVFALLPGPVEEAAALLQSAPDPARAVLLLPEAAPREVAAAAAWRIGSKAEADPRLVAPADLPAILPDASAVLLPEGMEGLDPPVLDQLQGSELPVLLPGAAGAVQAPALATALGRPVTLGLGVPPAALSGSGAAAARFRAGPGPRLGLHGRLGHAAGEVLVEAMRRAGRSLTRERLVTALADPQPFETGAFPPLQLAGGPRGRAGRIWLVRVDAEGRILGTPEEVRE